MIKGVFQDKVGQIKLASPVQQPQPQQPPRSSNESSASKIKPQQQQQANVPQPQKSGKNSTYTRSDYLN